MSKTILKNPIFYSDVPDVDVIRVDDSFYMVSTTMHVMPGCPIMKSKDLVNWEIQSYIYDTIEDNEAYRLENDKNVYGRGQWATSIRFNNGYFYACFVCNDMKKTYIYYTKDIESGDWKRHTLEGIYHDPSLLFENDRLFIIYSCGDITITELNIDASGVKEGGINQPLFSTPKENIGLRCEGCHAYHIGDYYYLIFIEWPTDGDQRRREVCYRSKELLGPYERKIIMNDDLGYHNKGVAQGAIFDSKAGDWYCMLFQDHDAVGRIPCILPMKWEDNWPVLGIDNKVPAQFEVPFEEWGHFDMVINDDFNHDANTLANNWQWNHNPDNESWSFTKNKGFLTLINNTLAKGVLSARNTLTQRTEGPACECSTHLYFDELNIGDKAGLLALQSNYSTVGVDVRNDGTYLTMTTKSEDGSGTVNEEIKLDCKDIWLKIVFDYNDSIDIAKCYYSYDNKDWTKIGTDLHMLYTLDHFMGYRIGLFSYPTVKTGGNSKFECFNYAIIK